MTSAFPLLQTNTCLLPGSAEWNVHDVKDTELFSSDDISPSVTSWMAANWALYSKAVKK